MTSKKKVTPIQVVIYVFLVLISITYIAPLLWVFNVSFKTNKEIFTAPFALPQNVTFDNYTFAWTLTFSLPITIFIMTGFFEGMPNELIECACMEGANIFQIFYRICLPLGRTGLFVTGLMTFIGNWNELLLAMVFISDDAKKTLPVSLSKFVGPYNTNYSQMFAAIIIAIIPTIIVYCAFSNQIVDGLTAGAVKG